MTEWGVVLVLIAIVGLISTVTVPVVKLNGNITKLSVVLDGVEKDIAELKVAHAQDVARLQDEGARKRERIHANIDKIDKRVDDHEKRIIVLEERK